MGQSKLKAMDRTEMHGLDGPDDQPDNGMDQQTPGLPTARSRGDGGNVTYDSEQNFSPRYLQGNAVHDFGEFDHEGGY